MKQLFDSTQPADTHPARNQTLTGIDNARIVLGDRVINGSIEIDNGLISSITTGLRTDGNRLDAEGGYVLPGLIDLHSDAIERQWQPRPTAEFDGDLAFVETDRLFALSGITTAVHGVAFIELEGSRSIERAHRQWATIRGLRPNALVRHALHLRAEVTQPRSLESAHRLLHEGDVDLISFMDHTPEATVAGEGGVSRAKTGAGVQQLARQAAIRAVPVASHDDPTAESVHAMARLGAGIFEFPVTLEAATAVQALGLAAIVGAPNILRGGSHVDRLAAADAIRTGTASVVCSDYAPAALLRAAFTLVERGICTLPTAVALMTTNPAGILGLTDRGTITPGSLADLILVHPVHDVPSVTHTVVGGRLVTSIPRNH